jgi:hypothetical protein
VDVFVLSEVHHDNSIVLGVHPDVESAKKFAQGQTNRSLDWRDEEHYSWTYGYEIEKHDLTLKESNNGGREDQS